MAFPVQRFSPQVAFGARREQPAKRLEWDVYEALQNAIVEDNPAQVTNLLTQNDLTPTGKVVAQKGVNREPAKCRERHVPAYASFTPLREAIKWSALKVVREFVRNQQSQDPQAVDPLMADALRQPAQRQALRRAKYLIETTGAMMPFQEGIHDTVHQLSEAVFPGLMPDSPAARERNRETQEQREAVDKYLGLCSLFMRAGAITEQNKHQFTLEPKHLL